jgi:hypothetical protein
LSTRVPLPVADDMPVGGNDECLRDCGPTIHQHPRRLAVGPAQAEAEFEVARELFDAICGGARVLGRERDELNATACELFAHLLVIRNFQAAWATPRRPDIHNDNRARKVRKAKATAVESLNLATEETFRQRP